MTGVTVRYRVSFGKPGARRQPRLVRPAPTDPSTSDSVASATDAARFLALGHIVDDSVKRGELPSYAEAARLLGITPPRMNQIVQLTLLAPDIQERVLAGELLLSARALRPIARIPHWTEQRRELGRALGGRP